MNRIKSVGFLLLLLLGLPAISSAQVGVGGMLDFELRKGGADSSPYLNQTPSENLTMMISSARVFLFADISDDWFAEAALQADYAFSRSMSEVFIPMANINWNPSDMPRLTLTAGSFPTPFSAYENRFLSDENPLINMPVTYARALDFTGSVTSMSVIYRRSYSQGVQMQFADHQNNRYDLRLAATMASVGGYSDFGLRNTPSMIARAMLRPVIWLGAGLSFSHGTYYYQTEGADDYLQTIAAADLELDYLYFRLITEFGYNRWTLPQGDEPGSIYDDDSVELFFGIAEARVDLPFYPGAFTAFRVGRLMPDTDDDFPEATLNDITRAETGAGYRLTRDITFKTSWMFTGFSGGSSEENVFAVQVSAVF